MDSTRPSLRFTIWTVYLGLSLAVMALRLMPHNLAPGGWPGPDLLVCLSFAWVLRRPDQVPVLALGLVFLTADLLYQRPPGLWAALALVASEVLRGRARINRQLLFPMEWALVAILVLGMVLAQWAVLGLTLVTQPGLRYEVWQGAVTVAVYPLVVAGLRTFGIRRPDIVQGIIRKGRP